jgi:hypothetical protein
MLWESGGDKGQDLEDIESYYGVGDDATGGESE